MTDRKRRILIVDDEPDILWSLSLLLERTYDVTTAEDGATALQALAAEPHDAVILDLMMPGMDGAALKREMDARGIDVPVLIVSAFSDVAERAAQLRVRDYMTKPIDIPKLETTLARLTASVATSAGAGGDGGPPSAADRATETPRGRGVGTKRRRDDHDARPAGVDAPPWQTTATHAGELPRLKARHALPRKTDAPALGSEQRASSVATPKESGTRESSTSRRPRR